MSLPPDEFARIVDAAAREVPGVTDLYYASALPGRLWKTTLGRGDTFSAISRRDGIIDAVVSIGVAHGRADDVARGVAVRVRDALGEPDARVTVRVSRITTV